MAFLADLLRVHERLDELFATHQELLLEQRLPEALKTLYAYRELLELHMGHEERHLLPVYVGLGPSAKWPPILYTGQHLRLRELLHGAVERLGAVSGHGSALRRGIIAVLEHETRYKHLLEHHDGAERQGLFAVLASKLEAGEQARIALPCLAEWLEAEAVLFPPATRAPAELRRN